MKKIEQSMIHSPVLNITTNEIINEDPEGNESSDESLDESLDEVPPEPLFPNIGNLQRVRRIPDEEAE